jgi:hypothetical protein
MTQEYIVGDVVEYDNKIMVVKEPRDGRHFDLSCQGLVRCFVGVDETKPVSLTPEILEKNGFEHDTKYWSRTGINDQELYDYYKKKELFSLVKDRDEYIIRFSPLLVIVIRYVHELQHFLFGLKINYEMEV